MKKKVLYIISLLLLASCLICGCTDELLYSETETSVETANVDKDLPEVSAAQEIEFFISKEDYEGYNYTEIKSILEEKGFNNVSLKPIEKNKDEISYCDGAILNICNEESASIEKGEILTADSLIVIEYEEIKRPEYTYSDLNATKYVNTDANVRNLPSKEMGDIIGGLSVNSAVLVTGRCNETGWYRIEYNGGEAYIYDGLLNDNPPLIQNTPIVDNNTGETRVGATGQNNTEVLSNGGTASSNSNSSIGDSSVTVPTVIQTGSDMVWIPTNGGTKYHSNAYCSKMKDPKQVSREQAEANGFTPCKKCH